MIKIDLNKQNEKIIIITGKLDSFHAKVKDITHITCEETVSIVHLADGSEYPATLSLRCFEKNLKDDRFFKIHRNMLINTVCVGPRMIHKERSININGIIIKASRRRFALLKKLLCGECEI